MKSKYKVILISVSIILVLILMIYIIFSAVKKKDNGDTSSIEDWEKEILYDLALTETERENIEKENLSVIQEEYLDAIRKCNSYLKEKYPEYNCRIESITKDGLFLENMVCYFYVDESSEKYKVIMDKNAGIIDDFKYEF